MREISPARHSSVDEYLERLPDWAKEVIESIRTQKRLEKRPLPSENLIDQSTLLTEEQRKRLLDRVACLVDENIFGRSEMCHQFALLLNEALRSLGLASKVVTGTAIYYDQNSEELFRWEHAWVRVGDEVIDGNVDSMIENLLVPSSVSVCPYWGPITSVPSDRRLRKIHGREIPPDIDVSETWWPELKQWIEFEKFR